MKCFRCRRLQITRFAPAAAAAFFFKVFEEDVLTRPGLEEAEWNVVVAAVRTAAHGLALLAEGLTNDGLQRKGCVKTEKNVPEGFRIRIRQLSFNFPN